MMKKSVIIAFILVLVMQTVTAYKYEYVQNVDSHTRYNPQREGCYYYYGYGSCLVSNKNCTDIPAGRIDKYMNLGDPCNRNEAPTIDSSTIKDVYVKEGETAIIPVTCVDQDPVNTTYSGWSTTKIKETNYKDAGTFDEVITCTDSFGKTASARIKIIIEHKNRPPFFKAVGFSLK